MEIKLNFKINLTEPQKELYNAVKDKNNKYILANYSRQQGKTTIIMCIIIEYLCRKKYKYLKEAYDKCSIEFAENREKQRELMYDRYLSIYQDAIDARDRSNAAKVLDSLTKLMGLNEPDKIDIKQEVKVSVDFNINNSEEEE